MSYHGNRITVSIIKACDLCGVSRRTIYNWIEKNKLEYVRTAGGSIRIFADTLFRPANYKQNPNRIDHGREVGPNHQPG